MSRTKIEKSTSQYTIVTVKPNSNKEIVEGELVMKINRRENEHGERKKRSDEFKNTVAILHQL